MAYYRSRRLPVYRKPRRVKKLNSPLRRDWRWGFCLVLGIALITASGITLVYI